MAVAPATTAFLAKVNRPISPGQFSIAESLPGADLTELERSEHDAPSATNSARTKRRMSAEHDLRLKMARTARRRCTCTPLVDPT
jgi:hypothetical protein